MFLERIQGIDVDERTESPALTLSILGTTLVLIPDLVWLVTDSTRMPSITARPQPPGILLGCPEFQRPVLVVCSPVQVVCQLPHCVGAKPFWSTLKLAAVASKSPSKFCIFCGTLFVSTQSSDAGVKSTRPI